MRVGACVGVHVHACVHRHSHMSAHTHLRAHTCMQHGKSQRDGEGQGRNKVIQLQRIPGTAHGHPKLKESFLRDSGRLRGVLTP